MEKITPFLWFENQAEEAANFYVSLFEDAKITDVRRFGKNAMGEDGSVLTVSFELEGQKFVGLNGGPAFNFTEAVSFMINCKTQEEVNRLWETLTANGGEESRCGWLKDRFGVSWQVIPEALNTLLGDPDPEKSGRVMQAMLQMKKIEIAELQAAYDGN